MWLFLNDNDEVSKLRERQGLVDLEGFDLAHETSLEGLFGVSGSGGVVVCGCAASWCRQRECRQRECRQRASLYSESTSNHKTSQWTGASPKYRRHVCDRGVAGAGMRVTVTCVSVG